MIVPVMINENFLANLEVAKKTRDGTFLVLLNQLHQIIFIGIAIDDISITDLRVVFRMLFSFLENPTSK